MKKTKTNQNNKLKGSKTLNEACVSCNANLFHITLLPVLLLR